MKESEYTPTKQVEFRRVFGAISGIVGANSVPKDPPNAYHNLKYMSDIEERKFVYIDLYGGDGGHPCGWGSPITAIEICEKTLSNFGLEYDLHFYERDHKAADRLDNIISPFKPSSPGCSIRIHEEDCANVLDLEIPDNSMGLVYADPYGNCEYIPYLIELSKRHEYSKIDFLVNANIVSVKRINGAHRHCDECLCGSAFDMCINNIEKKHKRVRKEDGRWQWTMILLTNTSIFNKKDWDNYKWFTEAESEKALREVSKTNAQKRDIQNVR